MADGRHKDIKVFNLPSSSSIVRIFLVVHWNGIVHPNAFPASSWHPMNNREFDSINCNFRNVYKQRMTPSAYRVFQAGNSRKIYGFRDSHHSEGVFIHLRQLNAGKFQLKFTFFTKNSIRNKRRNCFHSH